MSGSSSARAHRLTLNRHIMIILTPAIVVLFLFATAYPAWAHLVYRKGWVYVSSNLCTWARSEIYDGDARGSVKSIVALDSRLIGVDADCMWAGNTALPGYLQTQWNVHRFRADQTLYWCSSSAVRRNSETSHDFWIYWDFSSPPCGNGDYTNRTWSFHKNGGKWYGGDIWSGRHWWPTN